MPRAIERGIERLRGMEAKGHRGPGRARGCIDTDWLRN